MTRFEILMNKLINGESLDDWVCTSRLEEHLIACINKNGSSGLSAPRCVAEALLQQLADVIMEENNDDYILSGNAEANNVIIGKTFYSNNTTKLTGTIPIYNGEVAV